MKKIDRRSFLGYGAAAGASAMVSSAGLPGLAAARTGQEPSAESADSADELNIALIGAGAQGQVLIDSCLKIPGVRFRAVCDIWAEFNLIRATRTLGKYGHEVASYQDFRQMLAGEPGLDAVIIATPDFWHARQTIECLEAGLHVYCEKEMSNSLADARKMVLAARKTGKLLQIGHQRRSNPRYLHCVHKLLREAQILGRITTVNAQWNRSVQPDLGWPERYAIPPERLAQYGFESMRQFRNWRWYRDLGGGPIVDLGSHQIDIFSWFLDAMPHSVMASGGTDYYERATHEWYDTVMAIYEFHTDEGVARAYYQTLTTNSSEGYYEKFMGDEGTLLISEASGRGSVYREQSAPEWGPWVERGYLTAPENQELAGSAGLTIDVRETIAPPEYGLPVTFDDPYHKPHLENFFAAVRGQEELNCPAEVGYETAVAVLKVNQAVESGQRMVFDPTEFQV